MAQDEPGKTHATYEGVVTLSAAQYLQEISLRYRQPHPLNSDVARMVLLLRLTADQLERDLPQFMQQSQTLFAALREMVECYKEEGGVPAREQPTLIRNAMAALRAYTSTRGE